MIKRIWPALRFIFEGKPALSQQAQTALEKYLIDVDHISKSNLGDTYGTVSRHWISVYSAIHPSLSKSFYNEMLKVMERGESRVSIADTKSL